LEHPNIVPVYDVGATDQFPCFVVSKFVDGLNLSSRIKNVHSTTLTLEGWCTGISNLETSCLMRKVSPT
jgi:serine/threonine protein kinase